MKLEEDDIVGKNQNLQSHYQYLLKQLLTLMSNDTTFLFTGFRLLAVLVLGVAMSSSQFLPQIPQLSKVIEKEGFGKGAGALVNLWQHSIRLGEKLSQERMFNFYNSVILFVKVYVIFTLYLCLHDKYFSLMKVI